MRKTSEVLAIALEEYKEQCSHCKYPNRGYPYMCIVVDELMDDGVLTFGEAHPLLASIRQWIEYSFSLHIYLRRRGLPESMSARIRFYEDKLTELEEKGE